MQGEVWLFQLVQSTDRNGLLYNLCAKEFYPVIQYMQLSVQVYN